jgi:tetratricopeptide (TPR) repeat protein
VLTANFGATPQELNTLGYAHYLVKDYKRAVHYFQKAATQAPERYGVRFNLGMAYYAKGSYVKALQAFKEAEALLTPNEYFFPDIWPPYRSAESLNDLPKGSFELASWHLKQMMDLSQKGIDGKLSVDEQNIKSKWDKQLGYKLFYWMPLREVKIGNHTKPTL